MPRNAVHGVTILTTFSELARGLTNQEALPLGVLEDRVKGRIGDVLTDGRSRSVVKALDTINGYGILKEGKSKFGERLFKLRTEDKINDDLFSRYLLLISEIASPLVLSDDTQNGKAIYDPIETIEDALYFWANSESSEIFPDVFHENKHFLQRFFGGISLSIGQPEEIILKWFFSLPAIKRVRLLMLYIRDLMRTNDHDLVKEHEITTEELMTGSNYLTLRLFFTMAIAPIDYWVDCKTGRKIHNIVSRTDRNLGFSLKELSEIMDDIPIALRRRYEETTPHKTKQYSKNRT